MDAQALTQNRLKDVLYYHPMSGDFVWLAGQRAGKQAGCLLSINYIAIRVDDKLYYAHRLAWLYMYNVWPATDIDHKDRNPANNVSTNLRLATRSQNKANINKHANNTAGFKGVHLDRRSGSYVAEIKKNYSKIYIGAFSTPEAASVAYKEKAKQLFGEFANG